MDGVFTYIDLMSLFKLLPIPPYIHTTTMLVRCRPTLPPPYSANMMQLNYGLSMSDYQAGFVQKLCGAVQQD